ncbi:hypothetical protein AGR7A_pTi0069 [Agrobacterium deltaense NCPPB 1641]|uniref:Uncharacterized protein n=1 Tax=Agrobacterium deltaense NCPPB 1641 TaxID=1183425 RepID=A0A1S7UBR7_9HYPH|nr:hypothetical protein AGR7A_pTi0069 [Agrobacterium deltaense NCPPB 1641]
MICHGANYNYFSGEEKTGRKKENPSRRSPNLVTLSLNRPLLNPARRSRKAPPRSP